MLMKNHIYMPHTGLVVGWYLFEQLGEETSCKSLASQWAKASIAKGHDMSCSSYRDSNRGRVNLGVLSPLNLSQTSKKRHKLTSRSFIVDSVYITSLNFILALFY